MLRPSLMPLPYVLSTSIIVEEIVPTVHAVSDTPPVSRMGEQALQDVISRSGVSISNLELCYWAAEIPQMEAVFPLIQVRHPGASGLAAVFSAARTIIAGDANIIAAGGAGQFDDAGHYKKLVRSLSAKNNRESPSRMIHPLKGAGVLLLASTEAVGVHNLFPNAQITARTQMPFDQDHPVLSMRRVVQKALNHAQVDLTSIGEVIVEPPSLQQTWMMTLESEGDPKMVIKSLDDHTGESQGLRLVSQLITDLHSQDIQNGMVLQSAWDGTLLAGIFTKI